VRRRPRKHAPCVIALLLVMVACREISQPAAIKRATTLMLTQRDAAEYWLDSIRVYSGNSIWSIYFLRRDHVHREAGTLVTVNKTTGEVQRVPLR